MASASRGAATGNSIGREEQRPSMARAAEREALKVVQRCQAGFQASTASISRKVAKASFSHRPFHQDIVTRSPNHMWAFS